MRRFQQFQGKLLLEHTDFDVGFCSPGLKSVIQGYLPALVLSAILYFVPYFMLYLSQLEGYASVSHQERKAAGKFFNLLAGNVFLVTVLGGSLVSIIETFAVEPKLIPRRLAEAIPSQVRKQYMSMKQKMKNKKCKSLFCFLSRFYIHIWIKENGKSPCTCMHLVMVCMMVLCDTVIAGRVLHNICVDKLDRLSVGNIANRHTCIELPETSHC